MISMPEDVSISEFSANKETNWIQCNEQKPICKYCKNHERECIYPAEVKKDKNEYNGGTLTTKFGQNDMTVQLGMNLGDLELLHHYAIHVSEALTMNLSYTAPIWKIYVPQLGFRRKSIIHALLALSASHLNSMHQANRLIETVSNSSPTYYDWLAKHHNDQAFSLYKQLSLDVTENKLEAVVFNTLFFWLVGVNIVDVTVLPQKYSLTEGPLKKGFNLESGLLENGRTKSMESVLENDIITASRQMTGTIFALEDALINSPFHPVVQLGSVRDASKSSVHAASPILDWLTRFCLALSDDNLRCGVLHLDTPEDFYGISKEEQFIYLRSIDTMRMIVSWAIETNSVAAMYLWYAYSLDQFRLYLSESRPMAVLIYYHAVAIISYSLSLLWPNAKSRKVELNILKSRLPPSWKKYTGWVDTILTMWDNVRKRSQQKAESLFQGQFIDENFMYNQYLKLSSQYDYNQPSGSSESRTSNFSGTYVLPPATVAMESFKILIGLQPPAEYCFAELSQFVQPPLYDLTEVGEYIKSAIFGVLPYGERSPVARTKSQNDASTTTEIYPAPESFPTMEPSPLGRIQDDHVSMGEFSTTLPLGHNAGEGQVHEQIHDGSGVAYNKDHFLNMSPNGLNDQGAGSYPLYEQQMAPEYFIKKEM